MIDSRAFSNVGSIISDGPAWNIEGIGNMLKAIPNVLRNLTASTTSPTIQMIGYAAPQVGLIPIEGPLENEQRLAHPVYVLVIHEDDELVVSEPRYHIHGYGRSLNDALSDFRRVLVDSYELLQEDEASLDPYLRDQLDYMRSIIVPA